MGTRPVAAVYDEDMPSLAELPKRGGLPESATAILEALDTFAVVLDESLVPVYANPAARRGRKASGAILQTEEFAARARRVLASGTPSSRDPHPDDPDDTVRISIVRIEGPYLVVLAEDLGEERRLIAMRRDFIANVSHELKTPIAAVSLLSEAVREAADDPVLVAEFAASLTKEAKRLADLSRDIIQLSEAQSRLQPGKLQKVDLRELVAEEVEAHLSFARRSGVDLVITDLADPERKAKMRGRRSALASALANIIGNAIHHSPEGERVEVRMSHRKRDFVVAVIDRGNGIDPELTERIFERFYRVDGARSRDDGGTGLGLSIARNALRAHGGDITVRSEPGEGARFSLRFPLGDIPARKREKRVARAKKALKQLTDTKGTD